MEGLVLVDIVKRYGGFELRIPRLEVGRGSIVCIKGPNGSGKSTLLSIVAGIVLPDQGRVFFGGVDITKTEPEKRRFPLIRGEGGVFPHMSVARNISIARRVDVGELSRIMDILGIDGKIARAKASELSTGWKVRVSIARALASKPQVILVDEGLDHLDPEYIRCCLRSLAGYIKERGITALIVTHRDLEICDRVIMIREGRVEEGIKSA